MIRFKAIGLGMCIGILGGILIDVYSSIPPAMVVYAQEPEAPRIIQIETRINWTPERIEEEIKEQAERYGRDDAYMAAVIDCESMGSTTIQSFHRYDFTDAKRGIYEGERERSFGLAQIHLPDHPSVTEEEAKDPAFAINFMAKKLGKVKWYCEDII